MEKRFNAIHRGRLNGRVISGVTDIAKPKRTCLRIGADILFPVLSTSLSQIT